MECKIIKIQTPKKFLLDGIFLGSQKAKNVIIFIHGLGGNLFSQSELVERLIDKNNSVLLFNNRGNGLLTRINQLDKKEPSGSRKHLIGMAHEVFTDCVDDIDGAVKFIESLGDKNIFLMGHSTGTQKSVYYLSKKKNKKIKGAILLAPMSDFADTYAFTDRKIYNKAVNLARKMVSEGNAGVFLPKKVWPFMVDAQRFLSLFTPESTEEIFTYASGKDPKVLKAVKIPMLVILAEKDDFRDREIVEISKWFKDELEGKNVEINIIKNAPHNFKDYSSELEKIIKEWKKNL